MSIYKDRGIERVRDRERQRQRETETEREEYGGETHHSDIRTNSLSPTIIYA